DHVARLDARLLRRAAGHHIGHQCATRVGQAQSGGLLATDRLDLHADLSAAHFTGGLDLFDHVAGHVDWDREAHALVAAGAAEDLRVDADVLAAGVEQRAAGIAAIDRDVGLDERHVALV